MMIKSILLLILTLSMCQAKQVYFASVFRHGARYPIGDIWDGKDTKPFHGKLTSIGLREQYLLGNYIRNDYITNQKLVNGTINPREVEIFTVSSERCVESAYAHALGLFPFGFGEQINPNIDPALLEPPFQTIFPSHLTAEEAPDNFALDLGFQPVPIRINDQFFPSCPNQNVILSRRGQVIARQVAQLQAQHAAFTSKIKLVFNLTVEQANLGGLVELFDVITADLFLGRSVPSQYTDQDSVQLTFIQQYLFAQVYSGEPSRIFSTPFVNTLLANMDRVSKGQNSVKKMSIFSGHDTNVVPLMTFFNLTTGECLKKKYQNKTVTENCASPPPFASNLIFEMHQNETDSSFYVKLRYNGDYYKLCESNLTTCSLQQFTRRSKLQLVDFHKQCGVKGEKDQEIYVTVE